MLIVGLTGTSGSGKGYFCSLLGREDYCIIDTDAVYHGIISQSSECTEELKQCFGDDIINSSGGIDRQRLGAIVFSDKNKLNELNSIAHRHILKACNELIAQNQKPVVILDAPVLFESGFDAICDATVGVVASTETRVERIINRDKISRERALMRIHNQHTDDYFRQRCDYIIENDGEDLSAQAQYLHTELMRLYGEKKKKKK